MKKIIDYIKKSKVWCFLGFHPYKEYDRMTFKWKTGESINWIIFKCPKCGIKRAILNEKDN